MSKGNKEMVTPSKNSLKGNSNNASELDRIKEMQSRSFGNPAGRPGDAFVMPKGDIPETSFGSAFSIAITKKKKKG